MTAVTAPAGTFVGAALAAGPPWLTCSPIPFGSDTGLQRTDAACILAAGRSPPGAISGAAGYYPLSGARIIHRVGRLLAGEQIVFVGCASAHREAAFDAARFMMDYLKTDAPFWKAEERDGRLVWVDAQARDTIARNRWNRSNQG